MEVKKIHLLIIGDKLENKLYFHNMNCGLFILYSNFINI